MEPLIDRLGRWAREFPDDRAYTYLDYSVEVDGVRIDVTWAELDRRARAVAAELRKSVQPGARAAILAPQTLDYVIGFFGAMYARVIGVPLFSPDLPGHADRLQAVYADAEPECVLTIGSVLPQVRSFIDQNPVASCKEIVVLDEVDYDQPWTPEKIEPDDVAYLQYTSGSTRVPAGVMITHGNFAANAEQLWGTFEGVPRESTGVNWLPLFHDMGLITTCALPLVYGNPATLMDPVAFIMRPVRWLEQLSLQRHAFTGGPNFAYEYLATEVTAEEKEKLDLSGVQVFMNGAEPIRPDTLDRFRAAFEDCGLRPEAQVAAYGLAEATVYVASSSRYRTAARTSFDAEALTRGIATPAAADAEPEAVSVLVGCGTPYGQQVAIVDPAAEQVLPDGRVGEIWVHGPNVAAGYWGRPETTAATFGARLAVPAEGLPEGPWLRTGDLGLWHEGELYVTGRIKDLIIVDGRNHYPQDIEYTTSMADKGVRREYAAAFAIDDTETEGVVVVAERNRRVPVALLDVEEVARAVRAAVKLQHDVRLHDFVLIEPGGLLRTSSGKIARQACRQAYLDGTLPLVAPATRG